MTKPVTAQAPTQSNNEDYESGPLLIRNNAIQPTYGRAINSRILPSTKQSSVSHQNERGIYSGRNYSSEANGDIQIRMREKVIAKWGEAEWPAMHYVLDHESGSNPYAINKSSGACGIPQALPCSKLLDVIGSLDNIEGQLDWMVNYIAVRYGTPTEAMQFHQSHNWY